MRKSLFERLAATSMVGGALLFTGAGAEAALHISNQPTQNMSCSSAVCTATQAKAVLNIGDLTYLLASGDATVKTGSVAKDIVVKSTLSWTSPSRLTLDAQRTVEIAKPVTVAGTGALTIATNDGGKNGEFLIDPKQSVQFWNLTSSLIVDGNSYTLVGDIKTLAAGIAANPSGFYALAKPYDASADGTYPGPPVSTTFEGTLEGLGNAVANFSMNFSAGVTTSFGFFAEIGAEGRIRNFRLITSWITGKGYPSLVGTLAGVSEGTIESCGASGELTKRDGSNAMGGLLGVSGGSVLQSFSYVKVQAEGPGTTLGGLLGANDGFVSESYSRGSARASRGNTVIGGGLVGSNAGQIMSSYSLASVRDGTDNCCQSETAFGGLVGQNEGTGTVRASYAAGKISRAANSQTTLVGGLVGLDDGNQGAFSKSYWNLDKGVSDPSDGAGNVENDPGIKGLTTQQLQSALPKGFDPKIWGQSPNINDGYPYLLANPPAKNAPGKRQPHSENRRQSPQRELRSASMLPTSAPWD